MQMETGTETETVKTDILNVGKERMVRSIVLLTSWELRVSGEGVVEEEEDMVGKSMDCSKGVVKGGARGIPCHDPGSLKSS